MISPGHVSLEVTGLGIILYTPKAAKRIAPGSDYLGSNYYDETVVQPHLQAGTIIGFGTGSPGVYDLIFRKGYPAERIILSSRFKLRLGIYVQDQVICVRDLYDLMDWEPECPPLQEVRVEHDGWYHVTVCSDLPPSGILGDNQEIMVFLNHLDAKPALATSGVPSFV